MRRAVLVSVLVAACAPSFTPRSVLFDLRVLAIVATPLEVGPADPVTLRAVTLPPPGGSVAAERWTFCPISAGAGTGYACAVPACEVALVPAADGSVTATPGALADACLAALTAAGALPPGVSGGLPATVDTIFRYVATASTGETREAVQRVPLYPAGAPVERNVAPVVVGVEIGGQPLAPGGTGPALAPGRDLEVRVALDPASAQPYVDATGTALTEALFVSFYTTAGRYDFDRASGPEATVKLQYEDVPAGTAEASLWVVARDGRGGETPVGPFHVPLAP